MCKHLHAQIVEWVVEPAKNKDKTLSYHPHGKRRATLLYCLECDTLITIPSK